MALQILAEQIRSDTLYCSINDFVFKIRIYFIEENPDGVECLNIASFNPSFTNGLKDVYDAIKSKNPIEINILNEQKQKIVEVLSFEVNKCQLSPSYTEPGLDFEASFIVAEKR